MFGPSRWVGSEPMRIRENGIVGSKALRSTDCMGDMSNNLATSQGVKRRRRGQNDGVGPDWVLGGGLMPC